MKILRRAHEFAADHCRFVQYPQVRRVKGYRQEDWIDKLFKWGLAIWLLWAIWGGVILFIGVLAITFGLGKRP